MDLSNRGPQPHTAAPNGQASNSFGPVNNKSKSSKSSDSGKGMRILQSVLIGAVVVVLIGLLVFLAFGSTSSNNEKQYIDSNKLQAVFLNTGQVYFGNIKSLNSSYLVLENIYYLQTANSGSSTSSSTANTSVSLVKLGCELHAPLDQMIINRAQVTFWENLSPSGQVAKAVSTFEKDNPNGQKCSDQSAAGSTGTTPQAASNGSTTPATKQ